MDIFKQLSALEQVRNVIMTPSFIYSGTFYCQCWSVINIVNVFCLKHKYITTMDTY